MLLWTRRGHGSFHAMSEVNEIVSDRNKSDADRETCSIRVPRVPRDSIELELSNATQQKPLVWVLMNIPIVEPSHMARGRLARWLSGRIRKPQHSLTRGQARAWSKLFTGIYSRNIPEHRYSSPSRSRESLEILFSS
jgi:hypothetical protein